MIGGYRCCCYVDDCRCWGGNTRMIENNGDAGDRIALGSEPENGSDKDERMSYLGRMEEILEVLINGLPSVYFSSINNTYRNVQDGGNSFGNDNCGNTMRTMRRGSNR